MERGLLLAAVAAERAVLRSPLVSAAVAAVRRDLALQAPERQRCRAACLERLSPVRRSVVVAVRVIREAAVAANMAAVVVVAPQNPALRLMAAVRCTELGQAVPVEAAVLEPLEHLRQAVAAVSVTRMLQVAALLEANPLGRPAAPELLAVRVRIVGAVVAVVVLEQEQRPAAMVALAACPEGELVAVADLQQEPAALAEPVLVDAVQ